jgi:hypothetical protein
MNWFRTGDVSLPLQEGAASRRPAGWGAWLCRQRNATSPWESRALRIALVSAMTALCSSAPFARAQDQLDETSRAFLKSHCYKCHDESKQKGKFRLDTLSTDFTDPQLAEKWSEVVFRLNAGEMPPEDEPRPSAVELGRTAEFLTKKIRQAAAARMAQRGPVQHYRLSRWEYAHTVYDLLGMVFDVEAPGAFNEDPRWHGFGRIGALLSTAPSHIDRYFSAADTVVALAFPDNEQPSKTVRKSADASRRHLLQLGENWNALDLRTPGHYRIKPAQETVRRHRAGHTRR